MAWYKTGGGGGGDVAFVPACKYENNFSITVASGSENYILDKAFYNCINLSEIDFSDAEWIGAKAFAYAGYSANGVASLNLSKVSYIGESAFSNASLNRVGIINLLNCEYIDSNAFYPSVKYAANTILNIPRVKYIKDYAFCSRNQGSFSGLSLEGSEIYFGNFAFSGAAINGILNAPNLKSIGPGSNIFANNYISSINLPNCISIGSYAFYNCYSLAQVNIPLCETISTMAFYQCYGSLSSIEGPHVKNIGQGAFSYCRKLSILSFPECETIGQYAFYDCPLLSTSDIYFPNVTSLGSAAFANNSKITTFSQGNFPSLSILNFYSYQSYLSFVDFSLATDLAPNCFNGCYSLTSFSLPNIKNVGSYAFRYCIRLQSVYLPEAESIDYGAFSECFSSTTSCILDLPKLSEMTQKAFQSTRATYIYLSGCKAIYCASAFYGNSWLKSISLPECEFLEGYAFENCYRLTEISLPKCSKIGSSYARTFYQCSSLSAVYLLNSSVVQLSSYELFYPSTGGSALVYVPSSLYEEYMSAPYWSVSCLSSRLRSYVE